MTAKEQICCCPQILFRRRRFYSKCLLFSLVSSLPDLFNVARETRRSLVSNVTHVTSQVQGCPMVISVRGPETALHLFNPRTPEEVRQGQKVNQLRSRALYILYWSPISLSCPRVCWYLAVHLSFKLLYLQNKPLRRAGYSLYLVIRAKFGDL